MNLKFDKINRKKILILVLAIVILFIINEKIVIPLRLYTAISNGDCKTCRAILLKRPQLKYGKILGDPLIIIAYDNDTSCINLLINAGCDVNLRGFIGCTALHLALTGRSNPGFVLNLIKNGANVNAKDRCGQTPLYRTIYNGEIECTEILIENGANVNTQDIDGKTPLFYAVISYQDKDMTELLLKNGADPSIRDNDNKTVKDYLIEERVKANDKEKIRIDKMIKIIEKYEKPQKK